MPEIVITRYESGFERVPSSLIKRYEMYEERCINCGKLEQFRTVVYYNGTSPMAQVEMYQRRAAYDASRTLADKIKEHFSTLAYLVGWE